MRTVIVEDASRFARELMAQELGITLLSRRGVRLLTASGDDLTASDDATRIRQKFLVEIGEVARARPLLAALTKPLPDRFRCMSVQSDLVAPLYAAQPWSYALPIKTPVAKTRSPPTTTWKAARRNGVSI